MRLRIALAVIVLGVSSWLAMPVVFGEGPSGAGVCCSSSQPDGDCPSDYECRVTTPDDCGAGYDGECVPRGN